MVANKRNWNCDRRIIRATVLPPEEQLAAEKDLEVDEGGDKEYNEEEEEDIDAGQGELEPEDTPTTDRTIPPPPPPLYPPFTHDMGGSSTPPFSSLSPTSKWRFPGFGEGFTGMRADLGRLSGRMDSIEGGVSYFQGFVDR